MNIEIKLEDLSEFDTGGGMRECHATVTVDSKMPYRRQREAVIFETLALFLDTELELNREWVQYLTDKITMSLDAWEMAIPLDKDTLASIDKGMAESNNGQVINRGSFFKYTDTLEDKGDINGNA